MMNSNELKATARNLTVELLRDVFTANDAVQFDDASWAILQNIDGQEVWTEISVKSKAFKPTKVSPAFDPFVSAQAWEEEKKMKSEKAAEKAAEKARKIAAVKKEEEDE